MKTKFIIDISGIAYQIINRITGYGGKNIKDVVQSGRLYLQEESERLRFLSELHAEISKIGSFFNLLDVDEVSFAFDPFNSKSFRYDIFSDYKQTWSKKKPKCYDSGVMVELLQQYHDDLKNKGFKVLERNKLEADDIIYEYCKLYDKDYCVGIISMDGDLKQLLSKNVFMFNNLTNEVFIPNNFYTLGSKNEELLVDELVETDETDEVEDFFSTNLEDDVMDRANSKFFDNAIVVDPEEILIEKLLCGDKTDNITSFFTYETKNGMKEFAFTDKRYAQLLEEGHKITKNHLSYAKDHKPFVGLLSLLSETVKRPLDITRLDEYRKKLETRYKLMDLSKAGEQHNSSQEVILMIKNSSSSRDLDSVNYGNSHEFEQY